MARRERTELNLPTLDELFTTQEERDDAKLKRIYEIPLDEIDDFPNEYFDECERIYQLQVAKEEGHASGVIDNCIFINNTRNAFRKILTNKTT